MGRLAIAAFLPILCACALGCGEGYEPAPREEIAARQLGYVAKGVESYRDKNDRLPDSLGEVVVLGLLRDDEIPDDPWGNEVIYQPPAGELQPALLLSRGPDGVQGTADDVTREIAPPPALIARRQIEEIKKAIELFRLENARLPDALAELTADFGDRPDRYLDEVPLDPWGEQYRYDPGVDGDGWLLFSGGPDREPSTEDDIQREDR